MGWALVAADCGQTVGFAFGTLSQFAPLCPAGHLPHRWGERQVALALPQSNVEC